MKRVREAVLGVMVLELPDVSSPIAGSPHNPHPLPAVASVKERSPPARLLEAPAVERERGGARGRHGQDALRSTLCVWGTSEGKGGTHRRDSP